MSRKRHREDIQPNDGKAKKQKVATDTTGGRLRKQTSKAVDQLQWKKADIPTGLEDFEGFFGLEEVDGVEILKEPETGQIDFLVSENTVDAQDASSESVANAAESWDGFSDGGDEKVSPDSNQRKPKSKSKGKLIDRLLPKDGWGENSFKELETAKEPECDVSAWNKFGLSREMMYSLSMLNFSSPTPIQSAAIPEIIDGHDVIGKAPTGSGKTLAFGIPMLESLLRLKNSTQDSSNQPKDDKVAIIGLIIAPTRELAHQLNAHLKDLCKGLGSAAANIAVLTGGMSIQKQQRKIKDAHIVIATPGRLWERMTQDDTLTTRLRSVKILVLDEADRLLSDGHFEEVEKVLSSLDKHQKDPDDPERSAPDRQTLIFSATFYKDLQQKLSGKGKHTRPGQSLSKAESLEYILKKIRFKEELPKFVDVNPASQMATNLQEALLECGPMEKDLFLYALLFSHSEKRTLIFTNSISSVRRLTPFLQNLGLDAHSLHSQMIQKARLRSIERFSAQTKSGSILVASDVAARGLDIPSVDLIIHYHVPRTADMYIHRSGRTARAERNGSSILLCAPDEAAGVRRLIIKVHAKKDLKNGLNSLKGSIRSLDIDRRVVNKLKPRVTIAKQIADASLAKEKLSAEDKWLSEAAEELGVDYDPESFEKEGSSKRGRGGGKRKTEREASEITKKELSMLRAQLKQLLAQRINTGISERYLAGGAVNMDDLLAGKQDKVLGHMPVIGI